MFRLERRFADEMIAHAQQEDPNECCGILAGADGRVAQLYRTINADSSPFRYTIEPKDLLRVYREVEAKGWDVVGIYHSHTHTQAYPSATDVNLAAWPGALYFIVSLMDKNRPHIRAFHIDDARIEEDDVALV